MVLPLFISTTPSTPGGGMSVDVFNLLISKSRGDNSKSDATFWRTPWACRSTHWDFGWSNKVPSEINYKLAYTIWVASLCSTRSQSCSYSCPSGQTQSALLPTLTPMLCEWSDQTLTLVLFWPLLVVRLPKDGALCIGAVGWSTGGALEVGTLRWSTGGELEVGAVEWSTCGCGALEEPPNYKNKWTIWQTK
jgi:hypothetical protein